MSPAEPNAAAILQAHAWLGTWLFEQALPFWATHGHEGPGRGACEHLLLDGSPGGAPFKRMRVQARQIYCFAQAALLGWTQGEALARDGYAFITRCGQHPSGGWVRRLAPDGASVLDPAADLYDQAFVLLALAWYAQLTGEAEPAIRARRTVQWIRQAMATPLGGFHNALPPEPGPRQQNPHMHLFEAMLAWHQATADPFYARVAADLAGLLRAALLDRSTATLGEFFQHDWSPSPGAAGLWVEPGHHFEWVCLLDQYQRQTGASVSPELDLLYRFAVAFGVDQTTGLVWDAVDRSGQVVQRSSRLWPQTEALKAYAVVAQRGGDAAAAIPKALQNLQTRFLAGCPAGTWIDRFDAAHKPASDTIPTSSLYHLVTCYIELDRYARSVAGGA